MARRCFPTWALWTLAVLCSVAVLYVALGLPISHDASFACPLCRARLACDKRFFITISSRIIESDFSRYYRKHIDPDHQHIWQGTGGELHFLGGHTINADGGTLATRLNANAELAIVRSLPDRKTRMAFCAQFYVPGGSYAAKKAHRKVFLAVMQLNEAYYQNRARKDWPQVLRRVDFYPRVP